MTSYNMECTRTKTQRWSNDHMSARWDLSHGRVRHMWSRVTRDGCGLFDRLMLVDSHVCIIQPNWNHKWICHNEGDFGSSRSQTECYDPSPCPFLAATLFCCKSGWQWNVLLKKNQNKKKPHTSKLFGVAVNCTWLLHFKSGNRERRHFFSCSLPLLLILHLSCVTTNTAKAPGNHFHTWHLHLGC